MKNKNILEFCLSPDLGGLELLVLDYYAYFKKMEKCNIIVQKGSKLDSYLNENNSFYLKKSRFFLFFEALKLAKYIDKNNIDIIHFHWTKDILLVVLGKIFSRRKPKIIQSRHMTMTRFKDDSYHKWLYNNIDLIHAVTNQVKKQLKKYIPAEVSPMVETVYIGIEEKPRNADEISTLKKKHGISDEFIIGIVGRIEEEKGQYLLIESLVELSELNIKVLIIGHTMDEKYLNSLKEKIKLLELESKIVFIGFTTEVDLYMKICDSVILATKKETFGLVIIEAMINKACVIATANGGPLEIIQDHVNGFLFDRSVKDLANKIKLIYLNADLRQTIVERAYLEVKEKFDRNTQVNKLYELLIK